MGGAVSTGKERNIFELNLNVSSSLELCSWNIFKHGSVSKYNEGGKELTGGFS